MVVPSVFFIAPETGLPLEVSMGQVTVDQLLEKFNKALQVPNPFGTLKVLMFNIVAVVLLYCLDGYLTATRCHFIFHHDLEIWMLVNCFTRFVMMLGVAAKENGWVNGFFSSTSSPCASIYSYNKDLYLAFNLQLYDFLHLYVHKFLNGIMLLCHLSNAICTYLLIIWPFFCLLFVFSMDFLVCSKWYSFCCSLFLLVNHWFSHVCVCEISWDWWHQSLMQWFKLCVVDLDAKTQFPVFISSINRWFFSSSNFNPCRLWQHFGCNWRQHCWRHSRIQHGHWISWRYGRHRPWRNAGREKRTVFWNVLKNYWVLFLWKKYSHLYVILLNSFQFGWWCWLPFNDCYFNSL